ncbi:MAG TPA: hypothetical protein VLJ78_01285, partial [Microvirga sp.]|nr:hypothetical protein [Microvirga sp.]
GAMAWHRFALETAGLTSCWFSVGARVAKTSIRSSIKSKLCRMPAALREDYDFVREVIPSPVVSLERLRQAA